LTQSGADPLLRHLCQILLTGVDGTGLEAQGEASAVGDDQSVRQVLKAALQHPNIRNPQAQGAEILCAGNRLRGPQPAEAVPEAAQAQDAHILHLAVQLLRLPALKKRHRLLTGGTAEHGEQRCGLRQKLGKAVAGYRAHLQSAALQGLEVVPLLPEGPSLIKLDGQGVVRHAVHTVAEYFQHVGGKRAGGIGREQLQHCRRIIRLRLRQRGGLDRRHGPFPHAPKQHRPHQKHQNGDHPQ